MKIHRNKKRVKDDQDADRISNLPDGIRCHILSFMPTKSAIKMSVLSKQWNHLWTQVPVLDFSEVPVLDFSGVPRSYMDNRGLKTQQITYFTNFVHKVLLNNDVPFLRFFHLSFKVSGWDNIRCCVNSWLDIIAKRDIREIEFTYFCMDQPQVVLPTNFLSRERLVVLKLSGKFSIDDKMLLHLPNLEIVQFSGLRFPNDEFLKRMLSGCLVLNDLTITYCTGINNYLIVESLSLRRLRIWRVASETERVGIIIRTPNLRHLDLLDTLKQRVIADLSSLDEAYLNLMYENDDYALQVIQLVSGVTKLSLMNFQCLRYVSKPPMFQNLTWLQLDHAEKLFTILGCAPNLKYLIFCEYVYADKSLKSEEVPVCLSRLEEVRLYRFNGEEEEFELVEYLLKFASMLKKIQIRTVHPSSRETEYGRLLNLPTLSKSCKIIIE